MNQSKFPGLPERMDAPAEIDYSVPREGEFESLARDSVLCRSLQEEDLAALVKIARKNIGQDQSAYLKSKMREALGESGVRVSLAAEADGQVIGYIMARVDFGEFGMTEAAAVIDTIGVDPDFGHQHVGTALIDQLLANLSSLRIESVRTEVDWNQFDLLAFLEHNAFKPSQRLALRRRLR